MGMFDSIQIQMPVPDPAHQDLTFQTKDLACALDRYVILPDGHLVHEWVEREYLEDPTAPFGFRLRPIRTRWVVEFFHGLIRCYTSIEPDQWIEYLAWFEEGQCCRIGTSPDEHRLAPLRELDFTPWKEHCEPRDVG
jgi:hypothetical protein